MKTRRVRQPAVAGLFYPADPLRLEAMVDACLALGRRPGTTAPPKALIVPHAGLTWSGCVAARAFATLRGMRGLIRRVVLVGPAHQLPVDGIAVCRDTAWATPLGEVPVDRVAVRRLLSLPQVRASDQAHRDEHALEVQLPFLQRALGHFGIVPLATGSATPDEVAEVLDLVWGGPETLIVASSDLSHHHDYETARVLDAETARAIEALDVRALGPGTACGRTALRGLLRAAGRRGLTVETLDVRSSGDTAGGRSDVIGYGAWLLSEPEGRMRFAG